MQLDGIFGWCGALFGVFDPPPPLIEPISSDPKKTFPAYAQVLKFDKINLLGSFHVNESQSRDC